MDDELLRENKWSEVELFEKTIVRKRKKVILGLLLGLALFFGLLSIPVLQDRQPKWNTLRVATRLYQELERAKAEAIVRRSAVLVSIEKNGILKITQSESCKSSLPGLTKEFNLFDPNDVVLISAGEELDGVRLDRAIHQLCFDSKQGWAESSDRAAFVFAPHKDWEQKNLSRASLLEVFGPDLSLELQ